MPTALASPCPSGPVVVSTPGVTPTSGWPGVFECSWRKRLSSSIGSVVAGEVQQRVLQHRAVAVGKHEAIAIGPVRVARDCGADAESTAPPRSPPCPSACPDARNWPPARRPSRARGSRWRAASCRLSMAPAKAWPVTQRAVRSWLGAWLDGKSAPAHVSRRAARCKRLRQSGKIIAQASNLGNNSEFSR